MHAVFCSFKKISVPVIFYLVWWGGLPAPSGAVVFVSGLSWLRWVQWVTALLGWLFISSASASQHWGPQLVGLLSQRFRGRICSWFRSEILLSLGTHKGNLQRSFGTWHASPGQVWKKLLQSELSAEVGYLREAQGGDAWHSQHMQTVQRCWVSVWDSTAESSVLLCLASAAHLLVPLQFAGIPGHSSFVSVGLFTSYPRGFPPALKSIQIKH